MKQVFISLKRSQKLRYKLRKLSKSDKMTNHIMAKLVDNNS